MRRTATSAALEDVQPDQQAFTRIDPAPPAADPVTPAAAQSLSRSVGKHAARVKVLEDVPADQQIFKRIDPAAPAAVPAGTDASSQSLAASIWPRAKTAKLPPASATQPMSKIKNGASRSMALADAPAAPPQAAAPTTGLAGLKDSEYTDAVGDAPDSEREAAEATPAVPLTNQAMYSIIRQVAPRHSGDALYSAVSADREFSTEGHGAFQKRHFGLAFGLLLFTQESGQLGSVLGLMYDRDPERFAAIFGPDSQALLTVTNADTSEGRLQPVAGEYVWSAAWVSRFQAAGNYPPFQAAQNEHAIEFVFRPLLHVAAGFGLDTDRLLAMALDIAVTRGVGGAIRWLARNIGPLETSAQRYHAIEILGVDNLVNFQAEVGWTPQDGQFGPQTHAALAGALRRLDIIPMAKRSELACRLVASADGSLKQRLTELRDSQAFSDQVFDVN